MSTPNAVDEILEPATGTVLARIPRSSPAEVAAAVDAAHAAFPAWRDTPVTDRAQVLFRYKAALEREHEELARLVARENGKLLDDARGEVRRGIEVVDLACGIPSLLMGETVEGIARGIDTHSVRVPLGVAAGICPFNFPAMIPLWMFPLAIAAGNTFVLKPSDRTPLTSVRLAELLHEAGLPRDVLRLVHGSRETSNALIDHPLVRAVSFVGSASAAREVYARAAAAGKRVQALAGAKNHLIVMPDADLDAATAAILSSAFGAAGQRCLAGSVAVPVEGAGDPLVAALASRAAAMAPGDPLSPSSAMGPVIRADARARISDWIGRGLSEGARLVVDGRTPIGAPPAGGFFLGPTIFDGVRPEMSIAREEIFGPVLSVVRTASLDEAIAIANRSPYGNAASIFTRSGASAQRFRTRIEAGMVGINVGVAAPMAFFPFSGWKGSFFGDLHATGKDGVRFYTETRVVIERWS